MSKELLKSMLQDVIADRQDAADGKLHDYIVAKTKPVIGIAEATKDDRRELVKVETNNGDDSDAGTIETRLKAAGIRFSDVDAWRGSPEAEFYVYDNASEEAIEAALDATSDDEGDPDDYDYDPRATTSYSVMSMEPEDDEDDENN